MIDAAVTSILLGHAGLAALVGDMIKPLNLPDGTPKGVTFQKISDVWKAKAIGIRTASFQINCIAETPLEAKQIAVQVRDAFNGQHAMISGVNVFYSIDDDESDFHDKDTGLYMVPVDVTLDYKV